METPPISQTSSRPSSTCSSLVDELAMPRKLRLLVVAAGPRDTAWAHALIVRLSKNPDIEMRAIVDDVVPRMTQTIIAMENMSFAVGHPGYAEDVEFYRHQAYELVEWAHILVCVPLDADGIAKMLAGIADTLMGEVLRGWSPQKSIILVPGMSTAMWNNPVTRRHLTKLQKNWKWVQVLEPILWHYEGQPHPKRVPSWNSFHQVLRIVQNRADLLGLGRDIRGTTPVLLRSYRDETNCRSLPPEIWTLILEYADDWELAKALGVYTKLPVPKIWQLQPKEEIDPLRVYEHELEWAALTDTPRAVCKKLSEAPLEFKHLSALFIKLIIRFANTEVLEFLEANRPDLFMALDGTTIPTKASSFFPSIKILRYWKQSAWFQDEHMYDSEAVDGASKYGHIHILDWWWRQSGLPLRYTEAALEQASAHGHTGVLQWWQDATLQDESVVLRPGRALLWAAQFGQADVLRWWHASKISVAHGCSIVRTACKYGQPNVLEAWRRVKGDDRLYVDDGDIICATSHCHVPVLRWLRAFSRGALSGQEGHGQPIAFRVCDVQACLYRNSGEQRRVRDWWAVQGVQPACTASGRRKETIVL